MVEELQVPIHLKMTLTAREAAEYSNIGINKIESMLRSLRHGHPRPLRQGKILPDLRQEHSPSAEGKIRPQTAVGRRQFRVEKPLNGTPSRTAKAARQYDFPRTLEIDFYLST